MEAIRPPGRWILADGRDLYPCQGRMGVPLSGSRQEWQDGRFLPERKRDVSAAKAFLRKYLNNAIEQDHRRVKQRLRSMLGPESLRTAEVIIGGIELAEKIKKGQFKLGKLGGRTATMPEIWQAALAA